MAIYLKYSSPDIKGGVTTQGFAGQTNILSFSFGVSRNIQAPTGQSTNREASTPSVSEIGLTKELDEATGPLLKEAYNGAGKATAVLSFVRTDGGGGVTFLEYTLTNTMLSGWSTTATKDGKPTETFSLNFTKVETKIIPQNSDGSSGTAFPVTYDLSTQKLS